MVGRRVLVVGLAVTVMAVTPVRAASQVVAGDAVGVAELLTAAGTGEPSVSPTVEAVLPADVARALDREPDPAGLKATPGTVVPGSATGVRDVDLGGLGVGGVVGVGRPGVKDVPAGGVVPDSVEVELLGTSSAGLGDGVLAFRLAPADGKTAVDAAVTSVRVDYSKFAAAFGGDWASRLGLVKYPSCVLVRPDDPACQRYELIPVENDLGAGVLVATVGLADEVNPRLELADLATEPAPVTDTTVSSTLDGLAGQATGLSLESGLSGFVGQVAGSGGGVFALSAGTGSGGGDYAATSLAPSGKWQVALNSGSFGWSYPVPIPPATVGGTPSVSLEYSSQAVDGMTSSENTQPGPEGLGWSLAAAGFVERSYVGCANDGGAASNQDQCWYKDSATLSLNGQSGELVYGGSGVGWKLTQDPGWQIKKGTSSGNGDDDGEYWEVTTTDGTRYLFGYGFAATNPALTTSSVQTVPVTGNNSGEPCNLSPASTCTQAYRWNLDRIIDLDGNVTQFFYTPFTNKYNAYYTTADASYVRDAILDKIEYSAVAGATQPAHRIDFQYVSRCIQKVSDIVPACGSTAADWPDVPLDLECTSACTETAATFFTKNRLERIKTEAYSVSWRTVDEIELNHSLSASSSTHVKLLLQEIIRHGYNSAGASAVLPTVIFNYIDLDSRPDADIPSDGFDFTLFRLDEIFDELAGQTTVVYFQPAPCDDAYMASAPWGVNNRNCFPAWTSHGDWGSGFGIYNKWLTQAVAHVDNFTNASPADFWQYEYGLTGATTTDEQYLWHHSDNALAPGSSQVFNDWRGYPKVTVTYGASGGFQKTEYRYYRGMHGDQGNLPSPRVVNVRDSFGNDSQDSEWLAGQVRETRSLNSAGTTRLATTLNSYTKVATSASQSGSLYINMTYTPSFAPREAWIVRQTQTKAYPGSGGTYTISTTSYDTSYGLPIDQIAEGDPATGTDDRCTTTTYHRNASIWLVDPVKDTTVYGNSTCTTPSFAKTEYLYDGQAGWGTPPTEGHITKSRRYHTGSLYDETSYSQDSYGRPTAVTNPRDIATLTVYTPATHLLTTSTAVTKDWGGQALVTTTTLDNRRSQPTQITDPNSNITKLVYDHFGRLASVQLPTESAGATKSIEYTYNLSATNNARPWIKTKTLVASGPIFRESWTLLDSSGRTRQTQSAPAPGRTGAILTTTLYNARGLVDQASIPFGASSVTPGGTYQAVTGNYHKFTYDALDRTTSDTLWQAGPPDTALFGSLTTYGDLTTTVISPESRRVVTTKNLFGETAEAKTQSVAGADYAITSTTYTPLGKPLLITHPDATTTDYTYDLAGRVTSHDDPDRGLWTYAYDGNDNQTLMATNINSDAVCSGNDGLAMTYTSLDQPQNTYQDCGTGPILKQNTYYPNTDATKKGMLNEAKSWLDWNSTAKLYKTKNNSYDPRGRVTQRTYTLPNPTGGTDLSYIYNYAYNQANQVTSVIIPDPDGTGPLANETLNTAYDPGTGQALTLIGNTTYQAGATFSTDNLPTQRTLAPAGSMQVRRTYGYDTGTRRLTNIGANTDLTPGGSTQTLFSSILTYSNDGNITDLATSTTTSGAAVNQTQCFNYDDYSRLTVAWTRNNVSGGTCNHTTPNPDGAGTDPYYQEYLYDLALGKTNTLTGYFTGTTVANKVSKDLDFEDVSSPHAVTDVNETTFYEINANGGRHRQNGEPTANTYHRTNQLKKLVDNVSLTTNEYAYDTGGMRIAQKITPNAGSSVTASTTIYLEGQELTWTGSATTPTVDRYYQIPGGPTLALRKQTNTIHWLFNDHQQTSTHALQQNQTIPTAQRYLPFGQTRGTNNVLPTQHGFLGKTEDDTTRTVHTDNREYDPLIMQFTSVDPIVTSTAAPYNYASNNPLTLADPSGLCAAAVDPCSLAWEGVAIGVYAAIAGVALYASSELEELIDDLSYLDQHGTSPYKEVDETTPSTTEWIYEQNNTEPEDTFISPGPGLDDDDDDKITLYHYTTQADAAKIAHSGTYHVPLSSTPGRMRHGTGMYLTDLPPDEAEKLTESEHSEALFSTRNVRHKTRGYVAIEFDREDLQHIVAPTYGDKTPGRNIWIYPAVSGSAIIINVVGYGSVLHRPDS